MNNLNIFSSLSLIMAYLDPGSGSILIQLLVSVLIGVGIFFRARFGKLKNIFGKKTEEPAEDNPEDDIDVS